MSTILDTSHGFEPHPAALIFPDMPADQYQALKEDIRGLGLLEPIVLLEGKILDGRHRYKACMELGIEPYFTEFQGGMSETDFVMSLNLKRRHLNDSQRSMMAARALEYHKEAAKQRQRDSGRFAGKNDDGTPKLQVTAPGREPETTVIEFPKHERTAAAAAAEPAEVSPRSVERANYILTNGTERDIEEIDAGEATVKGKEKEIRQRKKADPKPAEWIALDVWKTMTAQERAGAMNAPTDKKMGRQDNDSIEWAQWSWNPVTGCKHDCPYCYARDIANRFYPQKFTPAFIPERLMMPGNTTVPRKAEHDTRYCNVFACSMADLFGRWVPAEWIEFVLNAVADNPQWNFLFLTKFPQRLREFTIPDNAWMGTTVDLQARVKNAEKAFEGVGGKVRWLSVEPMIEPLIFERLDLFDWVVVGGASRSEKTPGWCPPYRWVESLVNQADRVRVPVYMKKNLGIANRLVQLPFSAVVKQDPQQAPEVFHYLGSKQ